MPNSKLQERKIEVYDLRIIFFLILSSAGVETEKKDKGRISGLLGVF